MLWCKICLCYILSNLSDRVENSLVSIGYFSTFYNVLRNHLYRSFQTLYILRREHNKKETACPISQHKPRPLAMYYCLADLHPQRYYSVIVIRCCASMHCDVQIELYKGSRHYLHSAESSIRRKLPARFLNPSPAH